MILKLARQPRRRLTEEEQSLICLVNLLERLYTNPCYTTEFNRMRGSA